MASAATVGAVDGSPTDHEHAHSDDTPDGGDVAIDACGAPERVVRKVAATTDHELRCRPWVRRVTQIGWIAKALVYAAIAWAALSIALDRPTPDVDAEYTGLVQILAERPISRWLLVLIAAGLALYTAFRLLSVALIDENGVDAWAHRAAYLFSAATYAVIAWIALSASITRRHHDGGSVVETVSLRLMESQPGRVLLVFGSLVSIGIGAYFGVKGWTRRFMCQVDDRNLSAPMRRVIEISGAIGWIGRSAILLFVGVFVGWAAIRSERSDIAGFDRSMQRLADSTGGSILVGIVAVNLFVYAAYCAMTAHRRRLAWQHNPEPDGAPEGGPR